MVCIQTLTDHNDPICKRKHWKKCELTKHSSEQTSWDTNRTTPIQFPNSIQERSYVITRNINITRLWASTSRRIKRSSGWYRWLPMLLQSQTISYGDCWVRMHPVVRIRSIVPAIVGSESRKLTKPVEGKRFYWHNPIHSAWPWRWRTNSFENPESLSQRCVCVGCQLNGDQALNLLCLKGHVRDVTRRCDGTSWQEARKLFCIKITLLFEPEGFQQQKNRQKKTELLSLTHRCAASLNRTFHVAMRKTYIDQSNTPCAPCAPCAPCTPCTPCTHDILEAEVSGRHVCDAMLENDGFVI